jgi:hypothetical protein
MFINQKNHAIHNQDELFHRLIHDEKASLSAKVFIKEHGFDPEEFTTFINQNVNHLNRSNTKFTKFKTLDDVITNGLKKIAGHDPIRPELSKAFYHAERNEICITNLYILAVIPCIYPLFANSMFYLDKYKNLCAMLESESDRKYPKYYDIIPQDDLNIELRIEQSDINIMKSYCDICRIIGHKDLRVEINGIIFNPEYMLNLISFIKGIDPFADIKFYGRNPSSIFLMESNDHKYLIMPIYTNAELLPSVIKIN